MMYLHGNYALRGVNVRVSDVKALTAINSDKSLTLEQKLNLLKQQPAPTDNSLPYQNNLTPDHVVSFELPLRAEKVQALNIFFSSLNGDWTELYRAKVINGRWVRAIKVEWIHKNYPDWEQVDPSYPLDSKGKVDWEDVSEVH